MKSNSPNCGLCHDVIPFQKSKETKLQKRIMGFSEAQGFFSFHVCFLVPTMCQKKKKKLDGDCCEAGSEKMKSDDEQMERVFAGFEEEMASH